MPATSGRKAERDRDGAVTTDDDDQPIFHFTPKDAAAPSAPALRYVGQGASLPDVPARDLFADEIGAYDRKALIASGLYEK